MLTVDKNGPRIFEKQFWAQNSNVKKITDSWKITESWNKFTEIKLLKAEKNYW